MYTETVVHRALDPEIETLAHAHDNNPDAILEILQTLQEKFGGLTQAQIVQVAKSLKIPVERAYGVASFYSLLSLHPDPKKVIRICDGPPCFLKGSDLIRSAMGDILGPDWRVDRTSCLGLCDRAPAALVDDEQCGPLTLDLAAQIPSGWRGSRVDYRTPLPGEVRHLLANIGAIDPESIDSAIKYGAYLGLKKALNSTREIIIDQVEVAGVRGRGGAGFPAGTKWRYVAQSNRTPKYIVCNADESEPLVFKDRVLIETNPHQILEGMILAGYAVGAQEGLIYIRGEYAAQAQILEKAILQANERNYLGTGIFGSEFSFQIRIHRGAGAYICGEETALLESLEGRRGEPRVRPPYPTVYGYQGNPTIVNNVETFATVPAIIVNGADWYRTLGNPKTPGTKLYTLSGHINRPGIFEAPYGLSLKQIIDEFGDGMSPGSSFHFALTGGAAGTIVPSSLLKVPIDFDSTPAGISLGAGAFLICDQSVSVLKLLREVMYFFEVESCGKCTPCRIGTRQTREILDRMITGEKPPEALATLQQLTDVLQEFSFCGLGQFAAMPLRSAMSHFPQVFKS